MRKIFDVYELQKGKESEIQTLTYKYSDIKRKTMRTLCNLGMYQKIEDKFSTFFIRRASVGAIRRKLSILDPENWAGK